MDESKWPALKQLFSCYFHQDWMIESGNVDGVFKFFAKNEGSENAKAAAKELGLLKELKLGASEKRQLLFNLGCEYILPEGDEFDAWLGDARQLLLTAANAQAASKT